MLAYVFIHPSIHPPIRQNRSAYNHCKRTICGGDAGACSVFRERDWGMGERRWVWKQAIHLSICLPAYLSVCSSNVPSAYHVYLSSINLLVSTTPTKGACRLWTAPFWTLLSDAHACMVEAWKVMDSEFGWEGIFSIPIQ